MKIQVITVSHADSNHITFRCAAGTGSALWNGPPVDARAERHVELDSDDVLRAGVNVEHAPDTAPSLAASDDDVLLTARLDLVNRSEATARFSFDDGAIELELETSNDRFWAVGAWYTMRLSRLTLYDTDL